MQHCSTPQQRITWTLELLTSPRCHGTVSQLIRDHHVSRQTLYRWKEKAEKALQEAFHPRPRAEHHAVQVERHMLTLLIEAHASYREIQTCLQSLLGISLSVGTICGLVEWAGAQTRA
jgi:transposase-like protein